MALARGRSLLRCTIFGGYRRQCGHAASQGAEAARAQQAAVPVVGYVSGASADVSADRERAFLKGLGEAGYVGGQNVTVEYHWLDGRR
jgi:putative ABC transport system substrate-binding protein